MALITELDDRTLVEQHRAGHPDAFRRIVERHHRSLYANALRRLGDPVAAEDAVQDAFLRAFRNIERFDGDYHLDAWLHRIVTNTCHDIGRRRGRDTRLFDRACTEVEVEAAPADEAMDVMPREQINEALDALPESYREVLMLRFVEELSYADVAEQAGISEENARARVSRGRNMLKRMLSSTSALVFWAIPPLRRHVDAGTVQADAASAATQVNGLATIAASAPAPSQTFSQVSGIIAQVGPTIATAAPAASSTGSTLGKAAVAVGLAAAAAIPAGVAVDRAREPKAPIEQTTDDSALAPADAPITVETSATPKPAPSTNVAPAPVTALSAGDQRASAITDVSTTTSTPSTTATSEPAPTTSTPPTSGEGTGSAGPTPSTPPPADEEPSDPAPPVETAAPGQLSAAVDVTTVEGQLQLAGPLSLEIDGTTVAGHLEGKLYVGEAGKDPQARREVQRSTLRVELEDGRTFELMVYGWSTVTTQGNADSHALDLTFWLPGGADLGLAEDGQLEGTLVVKHGSGELGLAIPGAARDS